MRLCSKTVHKFCLTTVFVLLTRMQVSQGQNCSQSRSLSYSEQENEIYLPRHPRVTARRESYMAFPSEGFCCRTWLCKLARPLRLAPHPNYLLRPRQISQIRCSAADARRLLLMCTMRRMETPKQPFLSKGGRKKGNEIHSQTQIALCMHRNCA